MTSEHYGSTTSEPEQAAPGSVFPLRPYNLNDVFSGAFRMLRHSPRTLLGIPFLAGLINLLMSTALTVLPFNGVLSRILVDPTAFDDPEFIFSTFTRPEVVAIFFLSSFLTTVIFAIAGTTLVIPTLRAVYGYKTTISQAIGLRANRFLPLTVLFFLFALIPGVAMGLFILVVALAGSSGGGDALIGLLFLGFILLAPVLVVLSTYLVFSPVVVLIENKGPFAALVRSFMIVKGQFWKNFGTLLLFGIIAMAAMSIISVPAMVVLSFGQFAGDGNPDSAGMPGPLTAFAISSLVDVVGTTLVTGLVCAVVTMLYLNGRIRNESLDVSLLSIAEQSPDDGAIIPASVEHLGAPTPSQRGENMAGYYQYPGGQPYPNGYNSYDPYNQSNQYGHYGQNGQYNQYPQYGSHSAPQAPPHPQNPQNSQPPYHGDDDADRRFRKPE